jgi:hypothetical protein
MTCRAGVLWMLVLAGAMLAGCRAALPVYPAMSDEEALRIIADRQAVITSISAECELVLTSAEGQTVHLDGALVAQPPRRARLRAWKFGQAVFDLTIVDGDVWLMAPEEGPAAHRIDPLRTPARRVSDVIDLLGPAYFQRARPAQGGPSAWTVSGPALGIADLRCEIDRPTLTPRRFFASGEADLGEMRFEDYELINGTPWARTMRVRGAGGEIVVRLHDVELNGEVPIGAFVPPQRAVRQP